MTHALPRCRRPVAFVIGRRHAGVACCAAPAWYQISARLNALQRRIIAFGRLYRIIRPATHVI